MKRETDSKTAGSRNLDLSDQDLRGVLPFDPETKTAYINAIGTNETEALANFATIIGADSVFERIEFIPVKISPV